MARVINRRPIRSGEVLSTLRSPTAKAEICIACELRGQRIEIPSGKMKCPKCGTPVED